MSHTAGGEDLQSITSRHPAEQMAPGLVGLPSYDTLDSEAWRMSSPLEAKPVWMSVSLQVITFSEIWGRKCWWFSSAFWLPPYAGLGPVEAKVNEAHRGVSVWRHLRRFVRTSLWSSALFVCDRGVKSEALYTNAAFQQVKCSCSSGSGKSLQFDLR